nr:phenylalanine--tRNA ligase subunit beta [Synergistales bacterium]
MLLSWHWLNEYIDLKGRTIESVAEKLTMTGCEVESIETPCELLAGIMIARIEKLYPHPEADTLKVAEVKSSDGTHTCITAAPNLCVGDLVSYAPPGARLADGTVMGKKDFLGIASEGMLLSAEELGLPDIADEFGILKLPEDTPLDAEFMVHFGLDDHVMEISITPNRGDLLSVLGLAREVHALFPDSSLVDISEGLAGVDENWPYEFQDIKILDQGCTFYSLGLAENIRIGPSPLRERIRLAMMGMRPISNVVDATNLIMLLTGQPLHAFDLELLPQRSIEVRSALESEAFITLDDKEHVLREGDLLITSGNVPVGIAGVMGGQNSEIHNETHKVVIESAHFSAPRVSQTSRRLGINSEAAYRFARGVDPEKVIPSLNYALMLLGKWCGARVYSQKKIASSHILEN